MEISPYILDIVGNIQMKRCLEILTVPPITEKIALKDIPIQFYSTLLGLTLGVLLSASLLLFWLSNSFNYYKILVLFLRFLTKISSEGL